MSRLNRNQLKRMILKEFKMLGMGDMGTIGNSPLGMSHHGHDDYEEDYGMEEDYLAPSMGHEHTATGSVSKEDCCKAILCLIECCSCPDTKQKLKQCCDEILASC